MNEFDKTSEMDVSSVNKRRSFLKKSATGVVIASLPAKSVWGACSVSGALSGNLSTNTDRHDCTLPDLSNGCHPYKWKDVDKHCFDMFVELDKIKRDKGENSRKCRNAKKDYLDHVKTAKTHSLSLPRELSSYDVSCGDALDDSDGSIFQNLGAVYLNACFGFYPGYSGQTQAKELCSQVYLYLYMQSQPSYSKQTYSAMAFTSGVSESDLGYNSDGKTYWKPA